MKTQTLHIEGMTCNHCVMHVKKELSKLPNIAIEDVQIGKATVQFDETITTFADFSNAISESGYTLTAMN